MNASVKKSCFIITPIGEENSEIRRKADGVIKSAIKPVLDSNDFTDIKAAHEITTIGSINNQVITRIVNDDLVIANLTDLNPNVMYELAIRHATMKPVIHICEYGTLLPFDIKDQRTIFYSNDMLGVLELSIRLNGIIDQLLETDKFDDNPIYNAIKTGKILQDTATDEPIKYLLSKIESIESKIENNNRFSKDYKQISLGQISEKDIEGMIELTPAQIINNKKLLEYLKIKEIQEKDVEQNEKVKEYR